jgi:hypothetical protein
MKRGICKMCLLETNLLLSHLMRAALYEYCRYGDSVPIRVGDGFVMPTNRETKENIATSINSVLVLSKWR